MNFPTHEQMESTSHAELVVLVHQLIALVSQQQLEIQRLQAEVTRLSQSAPSSRNSSLPPSRDQKKNRSNPKDGKKHGPPFGHQRVVRALVDNPDRIISAAVKTCSHCQTSLLGVAPDEIIRHQVTELPLVKPILIETRQHRVICPHCQVHNLGILPVGLEADRHFGPQLEATVIYLKQQQHLSYERIVQALRDLCGVEISEGGISSILERASRRAIPRAEEIKAAVRQSAQIQSDETSARVKGRTWWQWVFRSRAGIYFTIQPRRNAQVIKDFMGEAVAEVWSSDCFSAQLQAPAKAFQLCLAHQLRDLQRILDEDDKHAWARAVQKLLREAIHLKNRFEAVSSQMTVNGYCRRVMEIENKLEALLIGSVQGIRAQRLLARFKEHREKLLLFLREPEVPPTNNASEQALRPSVIHRKVTNGFRSEWGAKGYAALQSLIATAKVKGQNVFAALVELLGVPVLPFLHLSTP